MTGASVTSYTSFELGQSKFVKAFIVECLGEKHEEHEY